MDATVVNRQLTTQSRSNRREFDKQYSSCFQSLQHGRASQSDARVDGIRPSQPQDGLL